MNEVTTTETVRLAAEINLIKQDTARRILEASVEIGRRLTEAKEMVPAGEWTSWLDQSVSYSERTAQKLMQLYREYGDETVKQLFDDNQLAILGNLEPRKALALATLPVPERKEYIETHDISAESAREVEKAVKAMKEAEAARLRAEADLSAEREISLRNKQAVADLEERLKAAQEQSAADPEAIRAEVEKQYAGELKKTSKAARADRKSREEAEKALAEAKEQLSKMQADADGVREAVEDEYRAKMEEQAKALEKKYHAMQAVSLQRFSILFELLQRQLSECVTLFGQVRVDVPEKADLLASAYNNVLETHLLGGGESGKQDA